MNTSKKFRTQVENLAKRAVSRSERATSILDRVLNSALSTPPDFQFRELDIGGIEDINVYTERLSPSHPA